MTTSSPDERNPLILRRTLGVISFLYAGFNILILLMGLHALRGASGTSPYSLRACLLATHTLLLIGAGVGLRGGLRWGWPIAMIAAVGASGFALDAGLRRIWESALLDGIYTLVTLAVYAKTRARA